jgi:DNA-binding response OmpR family regulator
MAKRVLIVDDDVELCRELAEVLDSEGYSVDTASDGKNGAAGMRTNVYDIVILDYRMPGFSGIELLKTARDENLKCKVYLATGRPFVDKLLESEQLSHLVAGVLSKPFDVKTLLEKLNQP